MTEQETLAAAENAAKETQARMLLLDEEISKIKSQLEKATARRWTDGVYADPEWWRKARVALRFKGRERQQLQTEFGALNKRVKHLRHATAQVGVERLFIDCARLVLTGEQYQRIWAEVEKRREAPG